MPLVYLHPIGLDGECWQFLPPDVVSQAVLYTCLWHGDRPRPDRELTLEAMADDVVEHVEGPLDLVGLSMGGAVAQVIALRHRSRVNSLVVACSSAGGAGARDLLEERAASVARTGMAGALEETLTRWFTPAALNGGSHPGVEYARRRLLSDDPEAFAASWRALAAHDTLADLPRVTVPTTVIHATEDAASRMANQRAMVDALANARLVTVPGPHMVQLECPQAFARALREHMSWVRDG